MSPARRPLKARDAERRFAQMLAEAGLQPFAYSRHDRKNRKLEFSWGLGASFFIDLSCGYLPPLDEQLRAVIREISEPIHITVPGAPEDPREVEEIPGLVIHRSSPLHPDDLDEVDGIRVTSVSRTLIDLAEVMDRDELQGVFARAREMGMLDPDALRASRGRVEWRPSLPMLDEVIEEFCGAGS